MTEYPSEFEVSKSGPPTQDEIDAAWGVKADEIRLRYAAPHIQELAELAVDNLSCAIQMQFSDSQRQIAVLNVVAQMQLLVREV